MPTLKLASRAKPYIMAHRGNRVRFPENTLSAFRQAVLDGADILETDIHLTSDGEIVCIHDDTVERTTDGTGRVADMSFHDLRNLNAANSHPDLQPEPIPTLIELTELAPTDVGIAVELKDRAFEQPENARRLVSLLSQTGVEDRTLVLSFHLSLLRAIRHAEPSLPVGWITLSRPFPTAGVDMIGPFWPILILNPSYVWWAHRAGQLVCPLDPVPEPRLWYYRFLGCDAVLSDDPAVTRQALGRSAQGTA